jgi:serine protease
VVTVGATRITGGITYYSTTAPAWTVGPGGGGNVDGNPGGYIWQAGSSTPPPRRSRVRPATWFGTSMASPHVAAVAALVRAVIAEGRIR